MRKWLEKWGSTAGALLCALVIIFAAVYTRQDDLRRLSAQNAASDQSQTLSEAQQLPVYFRPVNANVHRSYIAAYQTESGLWQMDPYVYYDVSISQEIRAVAAGQAVDIAFDRLVLAHENGLVSFYLGSFSPEIQAGNTVSAGQRIAHTQEKLLRFALTQEDRHIDPEAFFLSVHAK